MTKDKEMQDSLPWCEFRWQLFLDKIGITVGAVIVVAGLMFLFHGWNGADFIAGHGGLLIFLAGLWLTAEMTARADRTLQGQKIYSFLHGPYHAHKNDSVWLMHQYNRCFDRSEYHHLGVVLAAKKAMLLRYRLLTVKGWVLPRAVGGQRRLLTHLLVKQVFLSLLLVYIPYTFLLVEGDNASVYFITGSVGIFLIIIQLIKTGIQVRDKMDKIMYMMLCNTIDKNSTDTEWLLCKRFNLEYEMRRTSRRRIKEINRQGIEYIQEILNAMKESKQN